MESSGSVSRLLAAAGEAAVPQPGAGRVAGAGALSRAAAPTLLRVLWAFVSPITYYKQYSLSLSESLSKLAT